MLLNIVSANLIRNVRPFETLARSASGRLFTQIGKQQSIASRAVYRQNSTLVNKFQPRTLTKLSVQPVLKTQQRLSTSTSGDHVRLWMLERLVATALPVLLPAAFILQTPITDNLVALLVVMHMHWGLEALIMDYARPIVVGNLLPRLLMGLLYATSAATLAGLLMLIFNGPGLAKACKDFWAIGCKEQKKA